MSKNICVLGIETSCDETAVAVVTGSKEILSHLVFSQQEHKAYGGVVPEVAARAHLQHIDDLIRQAMTESQKTFMDLDAIAVTAGPGLIGGVLVGAMTAKAIAAVHDIPLIAVNHLEGHALTARLTEKEDIQFPYLLLLVSGGHTQFLVVKGVGDYERLGTTLDDAVGEGFDKVAKMLGLGYPGGPAVEKIARIVRDPARAMTRFSLPQPMVGKAGCDLSFSGLKTAVKRVIDQLPQGRVSQEDASDICYAFQETVANVLHERTLKAIALYQVYAPVQPTLVVAGGVAANKTIRAVLETLCKDEGLRFNAPPLALCTDNAAMIAWAGIERFKKGLIDAPHFPVYPRWPLEDVKEAFS